MAFRSLAPIPKEMRSLLGRNTNVHWTRRQPKSNLTPLGGGLGDLFKVETIKKNWETIPVFVVSIIAASFPIIHSIFRLTHAEDLRLMPGSKMKNQTHRYILEGPPKPTLYMVLNQKWIWPQGLLDALKKDDDNEDKCAKQPKRILYKFWKKDKGQLRDYPKDDD